jgi:SAM-dependent methyltransferase
MIRGGQSAVGEGFRPVPAQIANRLRCPRCGRPVEATEDPDGPGAGFTCSEGHRIVARGGYLDVSGDQQVDESTSRTFASFGYEWNTFDDVRPEDAEFADVYFKDLDFSVLRSRIGLDAGCGKGRYTRFVAPHLEALCALDGSDAVIAAVKNLDQFDNVAVVKSDLRSAPFADKSFGFISSLGVLHHLDDPRAGFERLVSLLAPGGIMLLYLYSRPKELNVRRLALMLSATVRRMTVRMPHRVLKPFSTAMAVVLSFAVVRPGMIGDKRGIPVLAGLPMSAYRGKPFRSLELDTFDRLSAPVENRYVWSDLEPWFARAGMTVDAKRDEAGWFVLAHLPGG